MGRALGPISPATLPYVTLLRRAALDGQIDRRALDAVADRPELQYDWPPRLARWVRGRLQVAVAES